VGKVATTARERAVGEGEALGPGPHQSGWESGPAEATAGQRAHLRGEVQAHRPQSPAGHVQEQVARPVGQFQHRPAGDEGKDRRAPCRPLPPGDDPGDGIVGPGEGAVEEIEEEAEGVYRESHIAYRISRIAYRVSLIAYRVSLAGWRMGGH
jgi:hypothetical protein